MYREHTVRTEWNREVVEWEGHDQVPYKPLISCSAVAVGGIEIERIQPHGMEE